MKKLIIIFISIILFLFIGIWIVVGVDRNSIKDIENDIIKNTDIKKIEYVNMYDGYYIVIDLNNLYLFNKKYEEIFEVERDKIYKNKNNYDIVYRNETIMYMDNYKKKDGLIFKYYDIYTYELIDEIVVGG